MLGAERARDRFGDPLPEGAIGRLGSMRLRHESFICAADFSPDGKVLAVADGSGHVTYWNPVTGRQVRRLTVSTPYQPTSLRFDADGKSLILASGGGAFRVVDAVTGAVQRKVDPPEHNAYYALAVARNGKTAVAVHLTGTLVVWDLADGKSLHEFKNRAAANLRSSDKIALTPDSKQVVLPRGDGSLHLVDLMSGEEVLAFEMPSKQAGAPQNEYSTVAISPDGRYLAYGDRFHAATLCDLKTGKRLRGLAARPDHMGGLTFTPNSRFLAVSGFADIRVFGVVSGKEMRTIRKPRDADNTLIFSPDGRMLAFWTLTCILLEDVVTDRPLHPPVGHHSAIGSLAFLSDSKRLVSSAGHEMIVWDVAEGRLLTRRQSGLIPRSLTAINDTDVVQFNAFESVHRWNLTTGREEQHALFRPPSGSQRYVLSADGRRMAAVTFGDSPQVHLLDAKDGRRAVPFALPKNAWLSQLQLSPDGRLLLLGSSDGVLRLLEGASGQLVRDLTPDPAERPASGAAFADDGRSIALFEERRLSIREIAGGGTRLQVPGVDKLSVLTYSPDGRFLAGVSRDGIVRVFGTATGKELACWQGKQGEVYAVAFSPDRRLLATGGMSGVILVWKLPESEGLPARLTKEEAATSWQALADLDAGRANRAWPGWPPRRRNSSHSSRNDSAPLPSRLARRRWRGGSPTWTPTPSRCANEPRANWPRPDPTLPTFSARPAHNPSAEAKRRIEALLDRLSKGGSPERLRCLRTVEVLERIGTPQAKDVLRELSRKSLPAELREEIEASLRRIEGRRQATSEKSQTP